MTICSVEGCDKPNYQHSYCKLHYWRWYRNGHTDLIPRFKRSSCSVEGCIGKGPFRHGLCSMHSQRVDRFGEIGQVERLRREPGTGTISNGYIIIYKSGVDKGEHVRIAERALGHELPPAAVVHHIDENPSNNDPSNLVVCPDQGYHMLIHQRMNALKACGNVNWRKCWICKTYDDLENLRKRGTSHIHLKCEAKYCLEKRRARS
jgi:hypothetical protein